MDVALGANSGVWTTDTHGIVVTTPLQPVVPVAADPHVVALKDALQEVLAQADLSSIEPVVDGLQVLWDIATAQRLTFECVARAALRGARRARALAPGSGAPRVAIQLLTRSVRRA